MMLSFCGGDVSSSIHLLGIHFFLFLLKQVYLHNGCYNSASVLSLFTKVMFVLWPKEKIDVRTNQYLGNLPYSITELYVWPKSYIQGPQWSKWLLKEVINLVILFYAHISSTFLLLFCDPRNVWVTNKP